MTSPNRSSFDSAISLGTMVYLPVKSLQEQLETFIPLHNQMTRAIHSHESNVILKMWLLSPTN